MKPARREVHAILDNYATHKHEKVRAWLTRHPSWTFHYTPTSSSRLNAVEGFFAELTRRRLERGVFHALANLQAAKMGTKRRRKSARPGLARAAARRAAPGRRCWRH